jgi:hypothetical protein
VDLLTEATEFLVRQAPGLISAILHRSTGGTTVAMYAHWRSVDEYQAMRLDCGPLPFFSGDGANLSRPASYPETATLRAGY